MSEYVLDSSALLALINEEPGGSGVEPYLPHACISTVNLSEVAANLYKIGISHEETELLLNQLVEKVIPFDHTQAYRTAQLKLMTKKHGLSIGDRACIALGQTKKVPVVTADKIWAKLDIGVKIILIR